LIDFYTRIGLYNTYEQTVQRPYCTLHLWLRLYVIALQEKRKKEREEEEKRLAAEREEEDKRRKAVEVDDTNHRCM